MQVNYFVYLQKRLLPLTVIFCAVLTLYTYIITNMYDPKLGEALVDLSKNFPQIFDAVGMGNVADSLVKHLNNYLFGFLYKTFPHIMILSGLFIALVKPYNTGQLATYLAAPISRLRLAATQLIALISQILILFAYLYLLERILAEQLFPGELDLSSYHALLAGLICTLIFELALSYLLAVILPTAKLAVPIAATSTFLICQMISQAATDAEIFKYFTPLTLFDQAGLIEKNQEAFLHIGILGVAALFCFALGMYCFKRQDISV